MHRIEMRDVGMKEISRFIIDELGLEAITARSEEEEMIALYTTEQLISPSIEYILSTISKNYSKNIYEIQFINMKLSEDIHKICYFDNLEDIKELLILIREMVRKEEEVRRKITELLIR